MPRRIQESSHIFHLRPRPHIAAIRIGMEIILGRMGRHLTVHS